MSASIAKTTLLGCTLAASSFSYGQSAKEFFTEGDFSFSIRARYEFADFDNRDEGNALTARTLIGYKFAEQSGIGGYVELVNVSAVDQDAYNGIVDGDSSKSIIADPTTSELNQAYVSFKPTEGLLIKGGRQRLIYDNARFIGNVGWRQNEQTFDAVSASYSYEGMKLSYAYLYEINRILADKSDWDSDSHLINLTYKGLENITFGAMDISSILTVQPQQPTIQTRLVPTSRDLIPQTRSRSDIVLNMLVRNPTLTSRQTTHT